ncbi:hypothetical protein GOBAR_AA01706 [Gossypium barbadense]|uniref:Protein kinase domain-containing protein n=1 Tax=Gossypium barbadense TaxID=3634 RepID=A0A2P5YTF9_GOSBA|nr:hypothetical protein GOBAR_AA01706 [Gossypium barbadense]
MDPKVSQFVILLPLIFLLIVQTLNALDSSSATIPMNCTDTSRLCTSFLAFKPQGNQSLAVIQSMFDVIPQDITVEGEDSHGYIFIKKNCSCLTSSKNYATNTTFTVRSNQGYVYDMILEAYDRLAMVPNVSRPARIGAVVSLRLFCGCSSSLWNYLMSYVMKDGDSVQSLASRFGVSMDSIEQVNGISNPDNVTVGALYYIPLNSVPGEPYHVENEIPPAPVPAPSADAISEIQVSPKAHVPYRWIIGALGVGLALIILSIVVCVSLRSSSCFVEARGSHAKDHDDRSSHKFHILRKPSFCCGSGRYICGKSENWTQTNGEPSNHQITIPNHTPLSWIMRVQIALDAARGLEYIHEHTKTHYVHRDIKSSNILLDGSFRAKISDFGLSKLVGKTNDEEATATKVVGTFGYLAPEYLSDGLASSKSDVYAFGVVLFEIISGKEAIIRTEGSAMKNTERRSLASIMLAALRNTPDSLSMSNMKDYIDPSMLDLYPHDCVFKMAMLAKQCVDEDPIVRPDMKQVVINLSQILLSSVEWEATLAGNSQVFSGLVQGR